MFVVFSDYINMQELSTQKATSEALTRCVHQPLHWEVFDSAVLHRFVGSKADEVATDRVFNVGVGDGGLGTAQDVAKVDDEPEVAAAVPAEGTVHISFDIEVDDSLGVFRTTGAWVDVSDADDAVLDAPLDLTVGADQMNRARGFGRATH